MDQLNTTTSIFGTVGSCTCGFADVPAELPCEVHGMSETKSLEQRLRDEEVRYFGAEVETDLKIRCGMLENEVERLTRLRAAVSQFLEDFRAGTHDEWQASLAKLREALRGEKP
jgi:hypothetical protein